MTEARSSALVARGVTKTFVDGDVRTEVLKGVDLRIEAGEFVALMGPSGSGKSTLLSILGSLLAPSGGEVIIAGENLGTFDEAELSRFRNRTLGFVFQFHHLLPDFTALENVMFPSYAAVGYETADARARAMTLLERVGLEHRVKYRAPKLSGGQKQRVAIARALMMTPRLVLCDEPTGNLDQETGAEIMALLREVGRDEGTAFLVSTHDEEVAAACDRLVRMVDGRIVEDSVVESGAPSK